MQVNRDTPDFDPFKWKDDQKEKSFKARLEKLEEYINLRLFHTLPTGDFSAGYIKALKDIKNHLREEEQ